MFKNQLGAGRINAFNRLNITASLSDDVKDNIFLSKHPFTNSLKINTSNIKTVRIFNGTDKLIFDKAITSTTLTVGNDWQPGVYYIAYETQINQTRLKFY